MCHGTDPQTEGAIMPDFTPLVPRQPVPDLTVPLVGGGEWSLATAKGDPFTMIVVYRGLHCPICKGYLGALHARLTEFSQRGVEVVAVSTDDGDRAARARTEWALGDLTIGHSMGLRTARAWGLFVSTSRAEAEPPYFAEPGVFLVRPDGTLYCAATQTMPFARPHFDDILSAIDFVVARDYPARGEVDTLPAATAAAE
jgi:peroxiredoxin